MSTSPAPSLMKLRERAGLTTSQAARLAHVSESHYRQVESGEAVPSNAWINYVVGVLGDELVKQSSRKAGIAA